ncbi:hypothetical protein DS641_05065 [Salmonella enterica subsp. enterica serovar Virchow]|nr:hypothetical protein [Salmonella enterica subsp. enterica serovar Braenderup]EBX7598158.1 hypothetical protein [Salmonella enterica subsp. enterica serovar Virchow]ECD3008207.1 hypothetical protein [Salmonella enterica subsp. enterica]EGO5388050.1 hypothetical protein [Salmonella enterica subsp. enterica serovar Typhimurium]WFG41621.1 hypothetical protein LFCCKGHI_00097 [Salmonella phage MET_P1_082_240]
MWLSAIHRDLPKVNVTIKVVGPNDDQPIPKEIEVGMAKFDRMEEGQFVVVDNDENEFMLFHPEVKTDEIKDGVFLASWQDYQTNQWVWSVAKHIDDGCTPNSFTLAGEIHVEPKPH